MFYAESYELVRWINTAAHAFSFDLYAIRRRAYPPPLGLWPSVVMKLDAQIEFIQSESLPNTMYAHKMSYFWIGIEEQSPRAELIRRAKSSDIDLWCTINGLIQVQYDDWTVGHSGQPVRTKSSLMCIDRIRSENDASVIHTHQSGRLYQKLKKIIQYNTKYATIPIHKDGRLGNEDATHELMSEGVVAAHHRNVAFDVIPGKRLSR